jgi:CDP-diacylglycerol--glycerol-3-phosphate 3-phosphatidyltransferase
MQREEIFSIPNVLSFARIFFVIPIYYFLSVNENFTALWFIVAAVFMDWLDGTIARKTNRITTLGKILDPLADKINTTGGFIALVLYQGFPLWIALVIILRDLLLVIGSIIVYKKHAVVSVSNLPGKIAVFVITLYGLSYILRIEIIQNPLMILTAVMIVISILNYAQVLFRSKEAGSRDT